MAFRESILISELFFYLLHSSKVVKTELLLEKESSSFFSSMSLDVLDKSFLIVSMYIAWNSN